jgi:predicted DNA-binding transcriptional regulator AlpA
MQNLELAPDVSSMVGQFWGAPDQALFTERTLVALTGLSEAYFQRARWSGDGPKFLKIGSRVRYRKVDICAWLNQGESAESTSRVVPIPALAARRAGREQARDNAKPKARTPVKQRKASPTEPREAEPRESREGAEQAAAQ